MQLKGKHNITTKLFFELTKTLESFENQSIESGCALKRGVELKIVSETTRYNCFMCSLNNRKKESSVGFNTDTNTFLFQICLQTSYLSSFSHFT